MNLNTFKDWALAHRTVCKYDDGQYCGQCVSLINQYCYRVLGVPAKAWGHAKDWPTNANVLTYFNHVSTIQPGDIVAWGASFGGGLGHIGIALNSTQMLDQNGDGKLTVEIRNIFNNRLAILRIKSGETSMEKLTSAQEKQLYLDYLGRSMEHGGSGRTELQFHRDGKVEQINRTNTINNQSAALGAAQATIADLSKKLAENDLLTKKQAESIKALEAQIVACETKPEPTPVTPIPTDSNKLIVEIFHKVIDFVVATVLARFGKK